MDKKTIFEKNYVDSPKDLIRAVFIFQYIERNIDSINLTDQQNVTSCSENLALLTQLFDSPLNEIVQEYFEKSIYQEYLSHIMLLNNLYSIKEKLVNACIEMNSELGEWLFEIIEIKGIDEDTYHMPTLKRKDKKAYEYIIDLLSKGISEAEFYSFYYAKSGVYITEVLRYYNLTFSVSCGIPFVFEVNYLKQINNIDIYNLVNVAGNTSNYAFITSNAMQSRKERSNYLKAGIYINTDQINIYTRVVAQYYLNRKTKYANSNIFKLIEKRIPVNSPQFYEYLNSAYCDFVMQHEIGHMMTDFALKELAPHFEKYFSLFSHDYGEYLADMYSISNLIKSKADELFMRVLLLVLVNEMQMFPEEDDEKYIFPCKNIIIRGLLDKNINNYLEKSNDTFVENIKKMNHDEFFQWIELESKRITQEINEHFENYHLN